MASVLSAKGTSLSIKPPLGCEHQLLCSVLLAGTFSTIFFGNAQCFAMTRRPTSPSQVYVKIDTMPIGEVNRPWK